MASATGSLRPHLVVFEDHSWRGLRPLAASVPVFELRCGLFSTRERLELLGARGSLRCRPGLAGLLPAASWPVADEPVADRTEFWLAGRLAPDLALVQALLALGAQGTPFTLHDAEGLVAGLFPPPAAAAVVAAWRAWARGTTARFTVPGGAVVTPVQALPGWRLELTGDGDGGRSPALLAALEAACAGTRGSLTRSWDVVPATAAAIAGDLAGGLAAGGWERRPFGLFAEDPGAAPWTGRSLPRRCSGPDLPAGIWLQGDDLWCADGVTLAPGAVLDTRRGAVVIDRGCDIASHSLLEGPLYLGPGCRVKAGARLYGESSFGIGNRLAGEIGESTFGDFTNKQHEGFIGHAVLGSWVNLGALTTCSDLKNNYGTVKVDLGDGQEATGQRFVGLLAGDHVKTAIGTLFNTGTCVGFASNIFGQGMPPKHVPAYSWGGREGDPVYGLEAAVATARVVVGRRGCRFLPAHAELFDILSRA
ncbi:MAG: hypothetical protein IPK64_09015 [bacterium]|nr:hypothetical protein [bacterium]